jgi:hypothetical protein
VLCGKLQHLIEGELTRLNGRRRRLRARRHHGEQYAGCAQQRSSPLDQSTPRQRYRIPTMCIENDFRAYRRTSRAVNRDPGMPEG